MTSKSRVRVLCESDRIASLAKSLRSHVEESDRYGEYLLQELKDASARLEALAESTR